MISLIPKKSIGVDIAENSIEVVQLAEIGTSVSVGNLGRVNLQPGVVKNGRIINDEELSKALMAAMAEAQPKAIKDRKIIFGFPESQTFFHIFSYKYESGEKNIGKEKMDRIVLEEAWSNIPIVKNEMVVYYQVLQEDKNEINFLIVAAMKRIVFEWQEFFNKLDLDVQTFDIEALANFRSLAIKSKKSVCIIDIGAATTNIYIFADGKIVYEHTIDIAGEDFTAEIINVAKTSREEAEKKKIEIGLSNPEEIFFPALIKILENILSEIRNVLDHYEKNGKTKIEKLVFIGGSSQMKGLTEYFQSNLTLPAVLGESKYLNNKKLEFIGAVGMALRGLDKKIDDEDPVIPFVEEKDLNEENQESAILNSAETSISDEEFHGEENGKIKKHSRKKFFLFILILGVVLFGAAFYYRHQEQLKQQAAIKANLEAINSINVVQEPENLATSTIIQDEKSASSTSEAATSSADVAAPIISKAKLAIVKDTEVGYLNVRSGAGTDFNVLTKVKPGETYELLENQDEWSKIKVSDEIEGWVASKYLQQNN